MNFSVIIDPRAIQDVQKALITMKDNRLGLAKGLKKTLTNTCLNWKQTLFLLCVMIT